MKETQSAGGVIENTEGKIVVVSQRGTSWSLPKGHIEDGEDILAAAKREIYEETGITELELVKDLGSYWRYKIGKEGEDQTEKKTIFLLHFKTSQTKLAPIDKENPEARWVNREDVAEMLTAERDADFFRSVIDKL